MNSNVFIRSVIPADVDALVSICRETYYETFFEAFNNPDEYNTYVDDVFSPARLVNELDDPDSAFCFAISEVITFLSIESISGFLNRAFEYAETSAFKMGSARLTATVFSHAYALSTGYPRMTSAYGRSLYGEIRIYLLIALASML